MLSSSLMTWSFSVGTSNICNIRKATKDTVCICEIQKFGRMSLHREEIATVRKKCEKWYEKQSCNIRKNISELREGKDILKTLANFGNISEIRLNYIGHNVSSYIEVDHMSDRLLPILKKYNVPLFYDRFEATSTPSSELTEFYYTLPKGLQRNLVIKSNQQTRDENRFWSNNFKSKRNASLSVCEKGIQLPKCSKVKRNNCSDIDEVACVDSKGSFKVLSCLENNKLKFKDLRVGQLDIIDIPTSQAFSGLTMLVEAIYQGQNGQLVPINTFVSVPESVVWNPKSSHSRKILTKKVAKENTGHMTGYTLDRVNTFLHYSLNNQTQKSDSIYILKSTNPAYKTRYSLSRKTIEALAKNRNAIINHFTLFGDGNEKFLSMAVE